MKWLDKIVDSFDVSPKALRPQLLLAASVIGHKPLVKLLLRDIAAENEVSPNMDAVEGECLVEAARNQHFSIVEALLDGGRFSSGNETRCDAVVQALEVSCTNGSMDIMQILLPHYLSYDVVISHHPRLLRLSLKKLHFEIVELLLDCDPRGKMCNKMELIKILREELAQEAATGFVNILVGEDKGDAVVWDAASLARGMATGNTVLVRFLVNHVEFCPEALIAAMETASDHENVEMVGIISNKMKETADFCKMERDVGQDGVNMENGHSDEMLQAVRAASINAVDRTISCAKQAVVKYVELAQDEVMHVSGTETQVSLLSLHQPEDKDHATAIALIHEMSIQVAQEAICEGKQALTQQTAEVQVDTAVEAESTMEDKCEEPVFDLDSLSNGTHIVESSDQADELDEVEKESLPSTDELSAISENDKTLDSEITVESTDNGYTVKKAPAEVENSLPEEKNGTKPLEAKVQAGQAQPPTSVTSGSRLSPTRATIVCPVKWVEHSADTIKPTGAEVGNLDQLHDGDCVDVFYKGGSTLLPGIIIFCHSNGTYDVVYEDGEEEYCVPRHLLHLVQSEQSLSSFESSEKPQEEQGADEIYPASHTTSDYSVGNRINEDEWTSETELCDADQPDWSFTAESDKEPLSDIRNVSPPGTEEVADDTELNGLVELEDLPEIPSIIVPNTEVEQSPSQKETVDEVRAASGTSQRGMKEKGSSVKSLRLRCRTADTVTSEEVAEWENVDILLNRKRRLFQSQTGRIEGIKVPWGEEFATIQSLKRFATQHPDVLREHIESQLRDLDGPLISNSPGKFRSPRTRNACAHPGAGQARESLLLMKDLAFLLKQRLTPFFDAILPVVMPTVFDADKRFLCETATEVLDAIILHCSGRKLALVFLQLGETYSKYDDLRLYNLTSVYVNKCVRNWSKVEVAALRSSPSSSLLLSLLAKSLQSKSAPVRISAQKSFRYLRDELGVHDFEAAVRAHVSQDVMDLVLKECGCNAINSTTTTRRKVSRRRESPSQADVASPTIVQNSPSILQRMLLQRQSRVLPTQT